MTVETIALRPRSFAALGVLCLLGCSGTEPSPGATYCPWGARILAER